MAKHLAKKAACLIGSAAVSTLDDARSIPCVCGFRCIGSGTGTSYVQGCRLPNHHDRFYDGDTSNNVPAGFDARSMMEPGRI